MLPILPISPTSPITPPQGNLYLAMGGEVPLRQLVDFFYDEMDQNPDFLILRGIHRENLSEARDKLFWFLSGFCGGPNLFVERFGHPRLRARHLPFAIGTIERDQWLSCMDVALQKMAFAQELSERLQKHFFQIADFMRNQTS